MKRSPLQRYAARLPFWVAVGAVLGVVAGVVFGQRTQFLSNVGLAYAMMLESVVYPYLISSLIGSLGSLSPGQAWKLAKASWPIYLFLWGVSFATILLLKNALPTSPPPAEIIAGAATPSAPIISLLIPQNIFDALGRGYVPAVVIFSVVFGFAVQALESKARLLEPLEVIRRGCLSVWGWIVYLAPIGVFSLFASTAGSIAPAAAEQLGLYIFLFLAGAAILVFWVLPFALSALVPERPADILRKLKPALLIAVVTTLSVAALPLVEKAAAEILTPLIGRDDEESRDILKATTALAYVFVQLGNYFIALFIFYACILFRAPPQLSENLLLPFMTLLSGIGSPSTTPEAVQFLSNWLSLPVQTLPLYIESMAVTRYAQVVLSVSAFGFAAVAIPALYYRRLRLHGRTAALALGGGGAMLLLVIFLGKFAAASMFSVSSASVLASQSLDAAVTQGVQATIYRTLPPNLAPVTGDTSLSGIRDRGVLRVAYGAGILPFSYFNSSGQLVGYDVSYAYALAQTLHVRLEFYPVNWTNVIPDLDRHLFDVVMGGAYLTDDRLRHLAVTDPYYLSPIALIAPSARADALLTYAGLRNDKKLTLAVFADPVLTPMVQHLFPNAHIVILQSYDELPAHPEVTAALWSLAQARIWVLRHPGYTAVAPENMGDPLVFSYLLPPDSTDVAAYLNLWLSLRKDTGFRQQQIASWITNSGETQTQPRWNVIDNILLH